MAIILVVDDRAINREFLVTLMGYAGHSVVESSDGAAALEMVRQGRPDLVISDIVMPTMDGLEFARCLRADVEIAHIPIIFYTASYRLNDARRLAQDCGISAVISKPSRPQVILDAVAAALGAPTALAPQPPRLAKVLPMSGPDLSLSLRLSLLIELGLELPKQRDPQQLLDLVCEAAQHMFSARYAAVSIVDEATGRLSCSSAKGFAGSADACFATLDEQTGMLSALLKAGNACRLQGLAGQVALSSLPAGHPLISALLVVPLRSAMRAYGWLFVANPTGGDGFSEADEQIALTLATKLAMAYENLLLYDTLTQYTARLEADSSAIKRLNAVLGEQGHARQMSETRFRLAMEVGTTLAYTLDRELRYTWAHSSQTDVDEGNLLGKTDFDLFSEDTARTLTALYRQVIASGVGLRRDVTIVSLSKPLELRYFELVVEPRTDADGALAGVICAALDISERKLVEEELRAAKAEADRASNAKSRFLAAASHDLRQPLSALSIYVNVIKSHVTPTGQPLLANLEECVGQLSGLLNDLLDLSKLDAGVVTPSCYDFSLAEMFGELKAVHSPEALAKKLSLRCIPSSFTAYTDPVLFRRIVGNFIDNAIRYTERGRILVACRRRMGKTWVEVWDTGMGIPADKTVEIFEEFKQLGDGARNRGSGLGLAIVARTAALLGLEFSVRSWPGRGSVFAVELPPGQALAPPALAPSGLVYLAPRALRIALVEDNDMVRQALVHELQGAGHHVLAAASGEDLCAQLGHLPPDIVVSDYRLQRGETGYEAIAAVRAATGIQLPAIIITGDTAPGLVRSMSERGVVVLHKPLDLETFQAYLEDLTYQG